MNCCIECFYDTEIRAIINSVNQIGNCDFCSSESVLVYDIDIPNPIADLLMSLIDTYTLSDTAKAKPLSVALSNDWDVFRLDVDSIFALTQRIYANNEDSDNPLLKENVEVMASYFHVDHAVVRGNSWRDFSHTIKNRNRFHNDLFNAGAFHNILRSINKSYPIGTVFYRARVSPNENGHTKDDMGAPPKDICRAGRINPEGIPVLYVASDRSTTVHEIRAAAFDFVTICELRLARDIEVVNLSRIADISPFLFQGDLAKYAINREVFKEIAFELNKPQRASDSPLEYLPTQFIAEFIKSKGYDGVEYASTHKSDGFNLAVFDESHFDRICVQTIRVSEISYKTQPGI